MDLTLRLATAHPLLAARPPLLLFKVSGLTQLLRTSTEEVGGGGGG